MNTRITAKVTPDSHRLIGTIAAALGEKRDEALESVLKADIKRVKADGKL